MNDIKRLLIIIAKQNKVNPDDAYFLLHLEKELEHQEKIQRRIKQ